MLERIVPVILNLAIYPVAAFLVSVALTRLCIHLLPRWGFVDSPDGRRIHTTPTPRGGGLAIIAAFFATSIVCSFASLSGEDDKFLKFFIPSALVILVCGVLDDRFSLPSKVKLLFQVVAGLLFWFLGARLNNVLGVHLPDLIALPLTVLWTVTIINAFNLIDGMDGVAAGLGCVAAISLAVWGGIIGNSVFLILVPTILAASCAGFLRYNFSSAKIFMGDTGSMFLGLFFAYTGLQSFGKSATVVALLIPVLAVGVPLFDVSLAFWRRLVRKFLNPGSCGIMNADLQHLHHRLLQDLRCSKKVALRIYLLACALIGMGFLAFYFEKRIPALSYAAIIFLLLFILRRIAKVELYDSALLLKKRMARSRKLLIVLAALPFFDLLSLGAGCFVAGALLPSELVLFSGGFLLDFSLFAVPTLIFLFLTGNYRIFWARAGYEDLRKMLEGSICGLTASGVFYYAFCSYGEGPLVAASLVITALVSFLGICIVRVLIAYFGMRMLWRAPQPELAGMRRQRLLIYGGGLNAVLYLTYCYNRPEPEPFITVGIVDDDRVLDGMTVFGFPVLGSSADLPGILKKYNVDKLIVTISAISEEKLEELRKLADSSGIALSRFQPGETILREPASAGADEGNRKKTF